MIMRYNGKYINLNTLSSYKIIEEDVSIYFRYRKKKKLFFGFIVLEEGYIYKQLFGDAEYYSKEDILEDNKYFIKDKQVYIKPHIIFNHSNESNIIYFNNSKELENFINDNKLYKYPYIKKY